MYYLNTPAPPQFTTDCKNSTARTTHRVHAAKHVIQLMSFVWELLNVIRTPEISRKVHVKQYSQVGHLLQIHRRGRRWWLRELITARSRSLYLLVPLQGQGVSTQYCWSKKKKKKASWKALTAFQLIQQVQRLGMKAPARSLLEIMVCMFYWCVFSFS